MSSSNRQTQRMSNEELLSLLEKQRTVSVTFNGPEYAALELLAEHRKVAVDELLKMLVREERDAAIELAKAPVSEAGKET